MAPFSAVSNPTSEMEKYLLFNVFLTNVINSKNTYHRCTNFPPHSWTNPACTKSTNSPNQSKIISTMLTKKDSLLLVILKTILHISPALPQKNLKKSNKYNQPTSFLSKKRSKNLILSPNFTNMPFKRENSFMRKKSSQSVLKSKSFKT